MEGRILKLPLDKENKLKEGSWKCTKEGEEYLVFWGKEKGGEWKCEKEISSYVWKGVVHEKDVCRQEHGRKLCVVST